jgi:NAD dependent epimerase/dehydratase family enzyme
LNRLIVAAISRDDFEGTYLAVSPNPVRNANFMHQLRRALHQPWSPPVPTWAVRIGSWLMRTEAELALCGRRCAPKRLTEMGFEFEFPELEPAMNELFSRHARATEEQVPAA